MPLTWTFGSRIDVLRQELEFASEFIDARVGQSESLSESLWQAQLEFEQVQVGLQIPISE